MKKLKLLQNKYYQNITKMNNIMELDSNKKQNYYNKCLKINETQNKIKNSCFFLFLIIFLWRR